MKTLLALTLALLSLAAISQPAIEWQNTILGSADDYFGTIQQTTDGGYIIGGSSRSDASLDKTENTVGSTNEFDYWIIKLTPQGNIEWQNTIGGTFEDDFGTLQQTSDGGYIVTGASRSDSTGDKTENIIGGSLPPLYRDFWILKLDPQGNIQWQNTIGGNLHDAPGGFDQTSDGGYILGGSSSSNISGDKTENNWDTTLNTYDYWIIKLDSVGSIQWQNTIGGNNFDNMSAIHQTMDGGYVVGGNSSSDTSGDKTENGQGDVDYWILKLDALGDIQWQNTIGGSAADGLQDLIQTAEGDYLLAGISNSPASGDKSENSMGLYDFWIIKLDPAGNILWENTIGGNSGEEFISLALAQDGGYILGCSSASDTSGDKTENSKGVTDYWVVELDTSGNIQWQKTIGGDSPDYLMSLQQTADGGYILGGHSYSNISGDKTENNWNTSTEFWVVKLAPDSVTVPDSCSFSYTSNQDTFFFQSAIPGATYYWDFGDGTVLYDTISNPEHIYPSPGTYVVCMVDENSGICSDTVCQTIIVPSVNQNLVWPGDANSDGIANVWDVLAIGIGYGNSGPARLNATTNWVGQPCTDWLLQFLSGVNLKHADCDGSAVIDSNDVNVISLNYGLTHAKSSSPERRVNPDLFLVFPQDVFNTGDTVTGTINLGSQTTPVNNIYGIAFSLTYAQNIIDSNGVHVDFVNSWFTPQTNRVGLAKDLYSASKVDIGLSRTSHSNASGSGIIANVSFVIQDNIDGKDLVVLPLELQFENVVAIDSADAPVTITADGDTLFVTVETIGTGRPINQQNDVRIFPNPANNEIKVIADFAIKGYRLIDLTGREVLIKEIPSLQEMESLAIDLSGVEQGSYFIHLTTADHYPICRKITVFR